MSDSDENTEVEEEYGDDYDYNYSDSLSCGCCSCCGCSCYKWCDHCDELIWELSFEDHVGECEKDIADAEETN